MTATISTGDMLTELAGLQVEIPYPRAGTTGGQLVIQFPMLRDEECSYFDEGNHTCLCGQMRQDRHDGFTTVKSLEAVLEAAFSMGWEVWRDVSAALDIEVKQALAQGRTPHYVDAAIEALHKAVRV